MTTTKRNPLTALMSLIIAAVLAFGMTPAAAFASPDRLTAEEIALRLADATESPLTAIDALSDATEGPRMDATTATTPNDADAVAGETLLTFEDSADAAAFLHEAEQRDGLSAEVLVDDLEGATIVIVTSANVAGADALIHAADGIDGVTAQPNYVYTLPNEVAAPEPIGEAVETLAQEENGEEGEGNEGTEGDEEPELPANFPNDPFAAKYQYQFFPVGDGSSKSGSNILEAWGLVQAQPTLDTVSVAVIDSGVNMNHEDLQDNIDYDHAYNVFTDDADVTDLIGHGSTVGGIIGATANNGKGIAGVADAVPGTVSVVPVKVFSDSGETYTDTIIEALDYVDGLIENGVLDDLRIINMSLGLRGRSYANPDNALYRSVSHLSYDHDVLVVGAGGNGDDDNQAIMDPMYPSDYEACLSVTALTETGANAYFSDYNQNKDISAPGVDIAGPSEEGNTYVLSAGTSHAAPIVSGVAALMLAVDPTLTPAETIDIIKSTAVPIPDRSENDWCELSGSAGALDAGGALNETIEREGAIVPPDPDDPSEPDDPSGSDDPSDTNDPAAPGASDDPNASGGSDDLNGSNAHNDADEGIARIQGARLSQTGDATNGMALAVTAAAAALVALIAWFQMKRSRSVKPSAAAAQGIDQSAPSHGAHGLTKPAKTSMRDRQKAGAKAHAVHRRRTK